MAIYDKVSIFTSIHKDLACMVIPHLLESDDKNMMLGKDDMMTLRHFCLNIVYIVDGEIHLQVKGIPMGSPISVVISEVVL